MSALNEHRERGVRILIALGGAKTPKAARSAVKRERQWAAELEPLLDPEEWELMEPLSPFRPEERIVTDDARLGSLGEDWFMAWQCHHARMHRFIDVILPARLIRKRQRMAASREADDDEALELMTELMAQGKSRSGAAKLAVCVADRTSGGTPESVQARLDGKYSRKFQA